MAKPATKESRIPQLGFSRPLAPRSSRIPLDGTIIFPPRTIPRPQTITTSQILQPSNINNKTSNLNQTTTIYQQHQKVFNSTFKHSNNEATATATSTSSQHTTSRSLNSSLNSTIIFDNVINSTFQNDSLTDDSASSTSSEKNCTIIRNKSQNNAVSPFNDKKVNLLAETQNHEPKKLDQKHIGEQVVIDGTELGTLKFIGQVQFDSGTWCGIELNNPVGKHDGMVKGVRYFQCRKNHGILAPLCKVDIVTTDAKSNFEKLKSKFEWYASKFPTPIAKFNRKHLPLQRKIPQPDETVILGEHDTASGPCSLIEIPHTSLKDETIVKNSEDFEEHDGILLSNLNERRRTYTVEPETTTTTFITQNDDTYPITQSPNDDTYPITNTENQNIISDTCQSEPIILGNNRTKIIPQLRDSLEAKRKNSLNSTFNFEQPNKSPLLSHPSLECDDSLGILTPNQMCIPKTPSTDDLRDVLFEWRHSEEDSKVSITNECSSVKSTIKNALLLKRSLPISLLDPKRKNSFDVHLNRKSPIIPSPCEESLGILTPNQMAKLPSTDDLRDVLSQWQEEDSKVAPNECPVANKKVKLPINLLDPNSHFKRKNSSGKSPIISSPAGGLCTQNSFECDESLGILTPNQMCIVKTPSTDDLRDVLFEWRRFDKKETTNVRETADHLEQPETESYEAFINRPLPTSELSMLSPNVPDSSFAADISLEILNDDILNGTHFLTDNSISNLDTTINMDLPLDTDFDKASLKQVLRCEQTPSPEELPLDPVEVKTETGEPVSNNSESKTKSSVTKTFNSFIMSVTSITSLDNGYQGDGEMSRPASRGGDHSPTVHKPTNQSLAAAINNQWQQRAPVSRRPDPMTDSDFFTESDADGHDENAPKGDRKVQVIDGQLYGLNALNPQPAGEEIFVNNQNRVGEEMDSSGIFTDLDTNTRNDELSDEIPRRRSHHEDQTPSDISTKTISENSQERQNEHNETNQNISQIENTLSEHMITPTNVETESKSLPGSCQSSPSRKSITSPKLIKPKEDNTPTKKYKMPRRNVVSKVKTMLETTPKTNSIENQENRKSSKKNGKWDVVMSKITDSKPKLKEVKSKVACGLSNDNRVSMIPKIGNTQQTNLNTKLKRRTRTLKPNTNGNTQTESIHSSLSDISNSGSLPVRSLSETANLQSFNRSAKKISNTISTNSRCTSPPSNGDTIVSPRYQGVSPNTGSHRLSRSGGSKKSPPLTSPRTPSNTDATTKRFTRQPRVLYNGAGVKTTSSTNSVATTNNNITKDPTRLTGAPIAKARSVAAVQTVPEPICAPTKNIVPQLQHAALSVEALGVLLQHLVFHYDAFKVPLLKKDYDNLKQDWTKIKLELDETRIGYRRAKELIQDERLKNETCQEEETKKSLKRINELQETHRLAIVELSEKYTIEKQKIEQRFHDQFKGEELKYMTQIDELIKENERWKTNYEDLKEKYDETQLASERINKNLINIENDYKLKLEQANEKINRLQEEFKLKESELNEKISIGEKRILILEEESKKVVDSFKAETKEGRVQAALNRCTQLQDEAESLRVVLDLKQKECAELRKKYEEASRDGDRDAGLLSQALVNVQTLQARIEDLEIQLQRKTDFEKQLTQEKKKLQESFQQESEQKKRLTFQNEELQWKLKQNSEVVNVILSNFHTPTKVNTIHGSNQSLNDDNLLRSPRASLARSFQTSSFSEKHTSTPMTSTLDKNLCLNRERFVNNCSKIDRKSPPAIDMYVSPPSSPKIKAVVEKCDSVSYVIEMDESPEVLANRMYRRSFRNSTPPKNTPTKSPNLKRYKSKSNHPLSLSASETSIGSDTRDEDLRARSKSMSAKKSALSEKGRSDDDDEDDEDDDCYEGECWKTATDSTNDILDFRQKVVKRVELGPTEISVESIADELIIDSDLKTFDEMNDYTDPSVHMSLPALPSELHRSQCETDQKIISNDHHHLLQNSFPKNSAGEAMISESNSEDECSTSVSSERSHSLSDDVDHIATQSGADLCNKQKTSQLQYDLMLVTESTISENMDCSWSDDVI